MLTYVVFLAVLIELLVVLAAVIIAILITIPVAFAIWNNNAEKERKEKEACQAALVDIVDLLKDYEKQPTTEKCKKINEAIRAYNQKCPDHTVDELDC